MNHRDGPGPTGPGEPSRYEFLVVGDPGSHIRQAFPEMTVTAAPLGGTAIVGTVLDQAHLYGFLARFEHLGVALVEMRRLPE